MGKGRKSALLTMVERKTLYTVTFRLMGKRADLLAKASVTHMAGMKAKVKTITFDNGLELPTMPRLLKAWVPLFILLILIGHGREVSTKTRMA